MPMSSAVPCFYCGHRAEQIPYGKAIYVGCGDPKCMKINSSTEMNLVLAVKSWNKEQKRLAKSEKNNG
jgi:hypothetical protein